MHSQCRIIVVEDHDTIRKLLTILSTQVDHCRLVAEAKTGPEALDVIRTVEADLLLIDLSLPHINGIDVIDEIRKENNRLKILVVTMQTDPDIINKAIDAGADGVVLKDSDIKIIKKAVLETLEGGHPMYIDSLDPPN